MFEHRLKRGTVYLLHFHSPYHHANHYVGCTERDVEIRLHEHETGQGSHLVKAVVEAGIDFELARYWEVDEGCWQLEGWLRYMKKNSRFCPVCCGDKASHVDVDNAVQTYIEWQRSGKVPLYYVGGAPVYNTQTGW